MKNKKGKEYIKLINEEIIKRDYVDQATAAEMLEVSRSRINRLCHEGRFEGAFKAGFAWLIPKSAVLNFQRKKRGIKSQNDFYREVIDAIKKNFNLTTNKRLTEEKVQEMIDISIDKALANVNQKVENTQ